MSDDERKEFEECKRALAKLEFESYWLSRALDVMVARGGGDASVTFGELKAAAEAAEFDYELTQEGYRFFRPTGR